MFANVATAAPRTRSASGRDRRQDHAEREERIAVALVDPGRDDKEREREDREPDQQGEPIRARATTHRTSDDHGKQGGRADHDRGDRPEDAAPEPQLRQPGP